MIFRDNLFYIVPADKATLNVLVVCKKYYLDVVLNELSTKTVRIHLALQKGNYLL